MKGNNGHRNFALRNTLSGFIEVTLWHGQRAFVKVDDITYLCEHSTNENKDGCRIGINGEALYCRDDVASIMSRVTGEQFRQMQSN